MRRLRTAGPAEDGDGDGGVDGGGGGGGGGDGGCVLAGRACTRTQCGAHAGCLLGPGGPVVSRAGTDMLGPSQAQAATGVPETTITSSVRHSHLRGAAWDLPRPALRHSHARVPQHRVPALQPSLPLPTGPNQATGADLVYRRHARGWRRQAGQGWQAQRPPLLPHAPHSVRDCHHAAPPTHVRCFGGRRTTGKRRQLSLDSLQG